MPKQATTVVLSKQEEQGLLQMTRRHRSEQQVALRAHIVSSFCSGALRGNFTGLSDLRDQVLAFIAYYNRTIAKPIKWTYTGLSPDRGAI